MKERNKFSIFESEAKAGESRGCFSMKKNSDPKLTGPRRPGVM
jgi:hypothetical protein